MSDLGNNWSNVSLIVRAIRNTMPSYIDLDFVIPTSVKMWHHIPKTWIYVDNTNVGFEIIDHLRTRLPPSLHGTIRPYNLVLHSDYRKEAMRCFREGKIRILVCTDALGLDCNIPDIDIFVQWKLPKKLSSFVERAGCVARGPGRTGLAVLLAEPAAFSVLAENQLEVVISKEGTSKAGRDQKSGGLKKVDKTAKDYARNRGRFHGNLDCLDTFDPLPQEPPVEDNDPTEGIYHFVQATQCRRCVIISASGNPNADNIAPTVPCCDICSPSLLDLVRPGKKPRTTRVAFQKEENKALARFIEDWREEIYERNYKNTSLQAENVLPDEAVSRLAHVKPPISAAAIRSILADAWPFWDSHGEELIQRILTMPVLQPSTSTQQQDLNPSQPHTVVSATHGSVPCPQLPPIPQPSVSTPRPDPTPSHTT